MREAGVVDIAHLRDFIAVVDAGSLSRAAGGLHVSQPALSQRMAQLETQLGVQLLVRGPRGVLPTPAGTTLYRDAQQLVRQFDRLSRDVAEGGNRLRGPVAVGLPTTVAAPLAPALFSWTKARHPGIHLQLFESMSGYIHELLLAGRLDLAAVFREDDAPRAAEVPLYSEELYLVGQPDPRPDSAEEVPLPWLRAVPLVTPGARSNLRTLVDRAFAAHGLVPTIVADVESLGTMIRIAARGEACTILPLSVVREHGNPHELGVRRIVGPVLRRHVAIRTATEVYEPREAVAAVRDGIVEVTRRLAGEGRWPGIS
ncbi:LysR substrate-binding domain-containing protein [Amycolatopsis endophytica]|uniref:LysR family nitrogen assimilation transcriptional regulator n=1 Tax=Amycolatopsis endophytica TaxID=860233 RepID=A0A853BBN9_9PSEU|nr:LysR substrate-binding domain-containing protein [Amycolatopsis endophytica]NYI92430.1 LysR family nitrogen assimilation transcriptional regulator [Amycolatopsis endophytica]